MNYLTVENLSKRYDEQALFENLTFFISEGQKVALVGKNGCGKSTLLNIISGNETAENGTVVFRKGLNVAFLPQNPEFLEHLSIRDYIYNQESETLCAIRNYEKIMARGNLDARSDEYDAALQQMDALDAWNYEVQIKQILGKLGIHDLEGYIDELSGGQKKRVAMAAVLVGEPDFLILDEPTNHLDIEAIEWLEAYLSTKTMSLLLVTHDRYFLEGVTNEIIEIDNQALYSYKGNYSFYLQKKSERKSQEVAEVAKAKNLLVKELEWLRRMPKARGSKAKYRVTAVHELLDIADKNLDEDQLTLNIRTKRQGKKILELHGISKKYKHSNCISDFSYTFKKQDRIGIVGKNGVGKSTFLNLIAGAIEPDKGEVLRGETIEIGYYHQEGLQWPHGTKVIDVVQEVAEVITLADGATITAAQFLNHFLFPHQMHRTPVEKLSGGERRRLQLLRVLIKAPNFLILDEPTNDLDILTMNVLEDYLAHFSGTLVIVSHNRYFMDKLTNHLFVFDGTGRIADFPGNYSDYKAQLERQVNQSKKEPSQPVKSKKPDRPKERKLSYREKQELETIETEIEELEKRKHSLIQEMHEGLSAHDKLLTLSQEVERISALLEEKEHRWLELSALQSNSE
jgi:ATP-binding cassette subfamily F protein uup